MAVTEKAIYFQDQVTLTIQGAFIVNGRDDKASIEGEGHYNLRFEDNAFGIVNDVLFKYGSGFHIIESEVVFSRCSFEQFDTQSSSSAVNYLGCNPVFNDCIFRDNEGAAIASGANVTGSPTISGCFFYNNVTSNQNMPQINLGPGATDTIYIIGNAIEGCGHDMSGGIAIADLMNTGATKAIVRDNVVKNNRYGYTQQGYSIDAIIEGNSFIDNNIETNPMNGGSGVSIYGYTVNCKAKMRNNLITGNLWGITAIYYHDIDLGTTEEWGYNSIYDNGNGDNLYALYDNGYSDISAIGNYWGQNDLSFAESVIWHRPDLGDSYGLVSYEPIWQLEPDIVSFQFTSEQNPQLSGDYEGTVDPASHTVTIHVDEDISLNGLFPTIVMGLGVISNPEANEAQDFSQPFVYTLVTPHGSTQEWTIVASSNLATEDNSCGIRLYPNPTNGIVNLAIDEPIDANVVIYDTMGNVVLRQNAGDMTKIDLSKCQSGIYFAAIRNHGKIETRTIIVQ